MIRLSAVFALAAALFSISAFAQPATGKEHFDRAMISYNLQDWPAAIRELKLGYQADPRPEYLFMLGQAQRLSGACADAILSYKGFVRTASGNQVAAGQGLIRGCEAELAQARKAAEEEQQRMAAEEALRVATARKAELARSEAAKPAAAPPAATASSPVVAVHHWYGDPLGGLLFFPGVAAGATGTVLLVLGNGEVSRANMAATQGAYDGLIRTGQLKQMIGVVALSAGAAVLAGGVIRYVVVGQRNDAPAVAIVPTTDGMAAVVSGSF